MEEKSKIYLFMELEISSAEYTKKKKEIIMFIQGETGIKLSDVIFKDDMFMTQVGKFSKAELLKKYKKQNCPEVNSYIIFNSRMPFQPFLFMTSAS